MRSAVFGRYWSTAGGAEKYGAVIAHHLAELGEVDLLTYDPVDVGSLSERLQVDLSAVRVRTIEDLPGSVQRASADYDRFVNVSFMSHDRAAHRNSVYVVHFPTPLDAHLPDWKRAVLDRLDFLSGRAPATLEWGPGLHHADSGRRGVTWTAGEASLILTTDPGEVLPVELLFGGQRPPAAGPCTVTVEVDGRVAGEVVLEPAAGRLNVRRRRGIRVDVSSSAPEEPVTLTIRTDGTFVPAELVGSDDRRVLGAPLEALRFGTGPRAALSAAFPILARRPWSAAWMESYGRLVANSMFTKTWVQRYWGADAEVLYPPVTLKRRGAKQPIILSVGRFFAADRGHSKKQLELVQAFRRLCDEGLSEWTLHLVGGCAPDGEPYLREVQEAGVGYPIELHVNAPGAQLADLYARASIYWHAAGLGENAERHPDRLEHFGISTVEAMSAGAVPVVVGLAGQLETVRHGVDGYHFRTLDDLVELTLLVIGDRAAMARMSESAEQRADRFADHAFCLQLDSIFAELEAGTVDGTP